MHSSFTISKLFVWDFFYILYKTMYGLKRTFYHLIAKIIFDLCFSKCLGSYLIFYLYKSAQM